jgi:hypothetical protein
MGNLSPLDKKSRPGGNETSEAGAKSHEVTSSARSSERQRGNPTTRLAGCNMAGRPGTERLQLSRFGQSCRSPYSGTEAQTYTASALHAPSAWAAFFANLFFRRLPMSAARLCRRCCVPSTRSAFANELSVGVLIASKSSMNLVRCDRTSCACSTESFRVLTYVGRNDALPVCRVNDPDAYNVSPATTPFKPAVLTYSLKCSFASLLRHPANEDRRAISRRPGSVMLLMRQAAHRLQKSSTSRR